MAFDRAAFITELEAMTVLELKELVEALEDHFGVTAAAPVAVAGAAGEAAAEQTEFNVVLVSAGPKKIAVIKEVRGITGLGLKEAKELVEAGGNIKEAVSKDEAAEVAAKLEEAGATVEVK